MGNAWANTWPHLQCVWKQKDTHTHARSRQVSRVLPACCPTALSVCLSVCLCAYVLATDSPSAWTKGTACQSDREEGNNIFVVVVVVVVVVVSVVVAVCLLCSRMHPASGLMCCLWWPTTTTATKVRVLRQAAGWSISIRSFIFSALSVSDWQTLQQIHLYLCIYKMQLQVSTLLCRLHLFGLFPQMPLIKFNCIYLLVFPLLITYHNNNNNNYNNNNNASRFVYGNFSCAKNKSEKENNKIKRIMQASFLAAYIPTL